VIDVPEWGTAVLARRIPATEDFDVSGCYPITPFCESPDLAGGLNRLRSLGAVSSNMVPDPLHAPSDERLAAAFDVCLPFKTHFIIDRSLPAPRLGATHRSNLRRALSRCDLKLVSLRNHLLEWLDIYDGLVAAKGIRGPALFPSGYFEALSQLPGLTTFAAVQVDVLVAAALWVRVDDCAYYHLAASRPEGYRSQAMYGLVAMAIDYFQDCKILHLGGVAGAVDSSSNGLARFKRGFANDIRVARLCGAILNRERYAELTKSVLNSSFFPAYRVSLNQSHWEDN
jgi:peptidoglycan biosynthesis/recognition FemAB-like protein